MKKLCLLALLLVFPLVANAYSSYRIVREGAGICLKSDGITPCDLSDLNTSKLQNGDTVNILGDFTNEGIELSGKSNITINICNYKVKHIYVTGGSVTIQRGSSDICPSTSSDAINITGDEYSVKALGGGTVTLDNINISGHGALFKVDGSGSAITVKDGKYTTDTTGVGIEGNGGTLNLEKGTFDFPNQSNLGFSFGNNTVINFGKNDGIASPLTPKLTTTTDTIIFDKGEGTPRDCTLNYYDGTIISKRGVDSANIAGIPSGYFVDYKVQKDNYIKTDFVSSSKTLFDYDWVSDDNVNVTDVINYALYVAGAKAQETVFKNFSTAKKAKIAINNGETPNMTDVIRAAIIAAGGTIN